MDTVEPGTSGQGNNQGSNACLSCRRVKMRCRIPADAVKCERCTRKNFDCVFQQHRRGRKHGMRLSSYRARNATATTETPEEPQHEVPQDEQADRHPQSFKSRATDFWSDAEGFQPPSLVNQRAVKGKFSLQNVLSTGTEAPSRPGSSPAQPSGCPISKGLLNSAIAAQLFEGFMKNLNPFLSQFDPILHTLEYVRARSAFLLTSILAAAAKAFNPALHPHLQAHAESLFLETFRRGTKSVEVVQAILLLTYWKDSEDTRAFVNVGIAIRICIELGWHKLKFSATDEEGLDEIARRQLRNEQRTWLVLFVYDRSISMQTGKPYMIERSDFIESIEEWYTSPFATTNDALLLAFVKLRLLTSDVSQLLTGSEEHTQPHINTLRPLLRILCTKLVHWESQCTVSHNIQACHRFLIKFYGQHILFILFSVPLQHSLCTKPMRLDLEAFWVSYNAAMTMLRLATEQSNTSVLYFAQDSVHIMTAHAAAFLIKLLFSIPSSTRADVANDVLETLRCAARAFDEQSAPPKSACALQAAFLSNAVLLLQQFNERQLARRTLTATSTQPTGIEMATRSTMGPSGNLDATSHLNAGIPYQPPNCHLVTDPFVLEASSITTPFQEYNFFDEQFWSSMFASAGFDVNDGVFLPDTGG